MATRRDWEDAALTEIAARGLTALAIPSLAGKLGVTKGSFYWHFRNLGDLIKAALGRWEEMDRAALQEIGRVAEPRARLIALFRESMQMRQAHGLYNFLSTSSERAVVAALRRINARRLQFLTEAYRELGLRRSQAHERAILAYAAYVGALQLRQQRSPSLRKSRDLAVFIRHAVETLIPRR